MHIIHFRRNRAIKSARSLGAVTLPSIVLLAGMMLSGLAHAAYTTPVVISGGIGNDGIAAMESMQSAYKVKVVFTGNRGMYLADVDVDIRDRAGNIVVNTTTQGPVLLADLAPGAYTLTAQLDGVIRQQKIIVSNRGLHIYNIRFPVYDGVALGQPAKMGQDFDDKCCLLWGAQAEAAYW